MFLGHKLFAPILLAAEEFRKQGEVKFEWFQWNVDVWEFTCARKSPWSRDAELRGL